MDQQIEIEKKEVFSEKDYKALLLRFLDGETLTDLEYLKLTTYEEHLKDDATKSGQKGQARTLSTPAGRTYAEKEKHESGLISSILVIAGVIALGIITAFIIFGRK